MESAGSHQEKGLVVSQLSREIVQLHARMYGRGPVKARSYLEHDFALCVLEQIFTIAEQTLVDAGHGDHVQDTRNKFQSAVRDQFMEIATRVTGRPVRSLISQVDVENGIATELFLFEPAPTEGDE
jgi:uncharacterized protein YbcI